MWQRFLELLFPLRQSERTVKTTTYDELASLVAPVTLPDGTIALLPYRTKCVRACIQEAKFGGNTTAQSLLGRLLAEFLQTYIAEDGILAERYVIQPVPLSKKRLRERGYNQVEKIAQVAAATLGLPLVHDVTRVRDTLPQTTLSRSQRLSNVTGAFAAAHVQDATYIVIDDVATTGATLAAVRAVLPSDTITIALAH